MSAGFTLKPADETLRRLVRERNEARDEVERQRAEIERLSRERDEARAEVERLRDALSEAALLCCDSAWSCEVVGSICSGALEAKP